jgi:hypothetical protein
MIFKPVQNVGQYPLDIPRTVHADIVKLARADFVVKMDHSVSVAGEKQKDFRRFRGDHAGGFQLTGDFFVFRYRLAHGFREHLPAEVQNRLERPAAEVVQGDKAEGFRQ